MKKLIGLILVGVTLLISNSTVSEGKMIKEYLGKYYISSYHASDNTPAGSRKTSSGAIATEWWTAAVDYRNPLVPMGSIVYIEGLGEFEIQDYGGFGRYNNGLRALDIFLPEGVGGLYYKDVYVYREETPEEVEARLKKNREESQQDTYIFRYNPELKPDEFVAAKKFLLKGTTVFENGKFYEVTENKKGLGHIIETGDLNNILYGSTVVFDIIAEEAVG